jgi:SAM-dependent methyltransferase
MTETEDTPIKQFRQICETHIQYIKNIHLPNFMECSDLESVLIEFRCLPHLEFLIRNTILKLGDAWCHSIICGNLNYDFMVKMCSAISTKIKIIKTNYDNLLPSEYSLFLSSLDFWNLLNGKKILIYQEDSIIFKSNIADFVHWDYIGAPWFKNQNDTKGGVGNGGISLRTKDVMVQIINAISIFDTQYNTSTIEYMTNTKSTIPPEDVYFSLNMENLNIGVLADRTSASNFSTECIVNTNSFAGHKFWLFDPEWKNRIFDNNVIQFNIPIIVPEGMNEHRGGWHVVKNNLIQNNLFSENPKFLFYDMLDLQFVYNEHTIINTKWCGIFHCTPITPEYLNFINVNKVFANSNFINSLENCVCIITLSNYLTQFFINKFNDMNINVPVYTLKHPVESCNIPLFNMNDFNNNNDKKIIQIGQQLRKITSIYLLPEIDNYNKLWLTGTKDFDKLKRYINHEIDLFNIDTQLINHDIMTYLTKYEDYDNLLTQNIVFVDFYDTCANNTVIECIIRNTPIVINKIPGAIDYLGENYPLYFNTLEEVPNLLTAENITKAYEYLCNMNKEDLQMNYFTKELMTILYNRFVPEVKLNVNNICDRKNVYVCNITGQTFELEEHDKHRELSVQFGYNSRFRAVCYLLTKMLFKEPKILCNIEPNKNIKGIGMSDATWAHLCAEKFDYINTFYHTEPYLDIYNETHVNKYTELDFIISSDVFEHVDPFPSLQSAFDNLSKMLKKEGVLIFSVPYDAEVEEHVEHYPNLYKYKLLKDDDNYLLYNKTIDGKNEIFDNLCFHGGPGSVLEMRKFSKKSITTFLSNSGFNEITFHSITDDMHKHGIFWHQSALESDLIITAIKM